MMTLVCMQHIAEVIMPSRKMIPSLFKYNCAVGADGLHKGEHQESRGLC